MIKQSCDDAKFKMQTKKRGKEISALSQIILLVVSIIAIAYAVGISLPSVSAQGECVSIYNSGKTEIKQVPSPGFGASPTQPAGFGFTAEQYCSILIKAKEATTCTPVSCSAEGAGATPSATPIVGAAAQTGFNKLLAEKGATGASKFTTTKAAATVAKAGAKKTVAEAAGKSVSLSVGKIIFNAGIAVTIYFGGKYILSKLGVDSELADSIAAGAAAGYATYTIGIPIAQKLGLAVGGAALPIAIGVGILVFAVTFHKQRIDFVSFTCYPWDAKTGGENCEKCNNQDFPCTEYQCKSLGQACELVNQGTTEELCVWKNRGDVTPPTITPWQNTLTTGYKYNPNSAISPPDRGVNIVPENNNSGCVAAFTPLRFGVTLDEPAKCKLDLINKKNFDDMSWFFGGSSTSKYNHSQTMSLPSPAALAAENITLQNGGQFSLYVRCEDANGNSNVGNFVFNFCVDKGQDITQPLIVSTSILNNFPIAFNQTQTDLQVYVNEPVECKWSKNDKAYDDMENQMTCATGVLDFNSQSVYPCSTNLTGLKSGVDNDFYFRCKDQPWLDGTANESKRNVNGQSYKFTLKGTIPLVIGSVTPNNTVIKDSTDIIKVILKAETSAGYDEGASKCSYSDTGEAGSFIEFYNTGTYQHSQDLYLPKGDYNYNIMCTDLGGNTDTRQISFSVETDTQAPVVVRVFHQGQDLKVITDENATCVYGTSEGSACNYLFSDGIEMSTTDGKNHGVSWNSDKSFYIKCMDDFGNQQPIPNQCSIIAKPFKA